ncbi:MAG: hypothetical protein Q4Q62_01065, partial [Thermoplasmata archaeon]|nr:hypothetical protein [Thermoplasmata archaeon]
TTALTSTAVTAFIFMYQISKGEFNNLQESQLDLVRIAGTLLIITTAATVAICIGEVIGAVQDPLTAVFCGTSFAIFIANGLIIMMTVAFDFFSAVIATRFIWKEAA